MKVFFALSFFCTILLALTCAQGDKSNFYSRRYDSIDVNTIFRSSRLLNNYVDCLLDKKPCPPEGKDLKRVLPDALKTRCEKCTKLQKQKALNVISKLYYEFPKIYTDLAERFDSTGEYTRNFENWFDEQNAVKPRPPLPQKLNQRFDASDDLQPDQSIPTVPSTQQAIRRSPNIIESENQRNSNKIPSERKRIPTSWVTLSTTITTEPPLTTRAPLRTMPSVMRSTTVGVPTPSTLRPVQPLVIDNIFARRPNSAITRSISKLIDSTEKVVKNVGQIFRSTIEIVAGPLSK